MKVKLVQLLVCLLGLTTAQAQMLKNITLLTQKIRSADSVQLISHELTTGYAITPELEIGDTSLNSKEWHKLHPPPLKFLVNGKLNRNIIVESHFLSKTGKDSLIITLLRRVILKEISRTTCDEPRHTIIIYKNGKEVYIDICFGCRRIHTSKDIDFSESYMDDKKWEELEDFFKVSGLTKIFE